MDAPSLYIRIPTVNKKQSIWKKSKWIQALFCLFFHDFHFVKIIEQKHSHTFTLEFEIN